MTAGSREPPAGELDPLPAATIGTLLASVTSLVWPELNSAAVSLAVLATFVVWVRALHAFRRRRTSGYAPGRLLPLAAVGTVGWSGAFLLGTTSPVARALLLGVVSVGLWFLSRPVSAGI